MKISVFLILPHSIFGVLLCELVFQLHRNDRKTVDKQTNVKCQLLSVLRIAQLPCHAENVFLKHDFSLFVVFGRRQIEHDEICRIHFHAVAQHIDNTALGDLSGQAVEELPLLYIRNKYAQLVHFLWLCILQKTEQPGFINGIFLIVVGIVALLIPIAGDKPIHNECLETFFFGVGKVCHAQSSSAFFLAAFSTFLIVCKYASSTGERFCTKNR